MNTPINPPGFDIETFAPRVDSRETDMGSIVENFAGPEYATKGVYPFQQRTFIEFSPYHED